MSDIIINPMAATPAAPSPAFSLIDPAAEEERRRIKSERIESAVLNGVDSIMSPEQKAARADLDAMAPDKGAASRQRIAHTMFLAGETGRPASEIGDAYDYWKALYSREHFDGVDDEGAFGTKVKELVTKRRDFRIQADSFASAGVEAALKLEPGDPMADQAKMMEAAKGADGFSPEDADKFSNAYRQARDAAESKVGPFRPIAKQIRALLEQDAGKKDGGTGDHFAAALDAAASIPHEVLPYVYQMIDDTAPDASGAATKAGKNLKRGLLNSLSGIASNAVRTDILNLQERLKGNESLAKGGVVKVRTDGDLQKSFQALTGNQLASESGDMMTSYRAATPEERTKLSEMADKALKRNIVAGQLLQIEQQNVDPATSKNFLAKAFYSAAYSAGAMAPMIANPSIGAVIAQGSYADTEFQRQISLGTDPKTAHVMGNITGAVQAGLENFGVHLITGGAGKMAGAALEKLPWVAKMAPGQLPFGAGTGAAAARIAGGVGMQQAGEYTEEKAQDATQIFTARLVEGMGMTLPQQASIAAEIKSFKLWDPEMFLSLLPITGGAGGYHAFQENKQAQAARDTLLSDPVAMQAVGASVEDASRVAAMAPEARAAAWQGVATTLDPGTEAAGQAQAAIVERQKAGAAQVETVKEAMAREDITFEKGNRDGQSIYRVTKGDITTEHGDAASAFAAVQDHMDHADRTANQSGLEMFAALSGRATAPTTEASFTIEGEQQSAIEYLNDAQKRADNESLPKPERDRAAAEFKAMSDRMDIYEKANPDKATDWSKTYVGGSSEMVRTKEGAYRAVLKVANGEGAYTVLEEHVEADAGAFVASGQTTWDALADMIREVEAKTGDTYLHAHTGGQDAAKDILATKEAYSALAQVFVTGQSRAAQKDSTDVAFAARQARMGARQNLRRLMASGQVAGPLVARLRAYAEWLKAVVSRAIRLNRARRESGGKLAIDEFLNKSIGMEADAQHVQGVINEAKRIMPEGDGPGFNLSLDYRLSLEAHLEKGVKAAKAIFDDLTEDSSARELGDAQSEAMLEIFDRLPLPDGWEYTRKGQWAPSGQGAALSGRSTSSWYAEVENEAVVDGDEEPIKRKLTVRDHENFSTKHKGPDFAAIVPQGIVWNPSEAAKAITRIMEKLAQKSQSTLAKSEETVQGSGSEKTGYLPIGAEGGPLAGNSGTNMNQPPESVAGANPPQSGAPVNVSFRLTPIATLDRLAADIERRKRDPEMRRKIYDNMKAALNTLRTRWSEVQQRWNGESLPVVEQKSKKELDKEQAFREALAYQDAEASIYNTLTPEAQAALGMTGEDVSAYAGPLAQRFTGGRFGTSGRIMGRGEARKQASQAGHAMGGEYDGAEGLPAMFFGGSLSVDEAAQEAFEKGEISEATPDALWDAMRSELQTQASNKEAMKSALATLKESQKQARNKAREEAADWRTQQDEMQSKDWDSRAVMLRHLRTLDALLSALPPEVRAKVGGWTAIASLKTQKAMQKELEHRLAVADEYLEKALKKDALASIAKLMEKAAPDREAGQKSKGKLGAAVHRFFDEVERVMILTPEQVEAENLTLDAALVADGVTEAQQADIFEKQQALDMFGALGKPKAHDAAHVVRALDMLEHIYTTGRNRWRMLEEARLEQVAGLAGEVVDVLGGASYTGSQGQKAKSATAKGKAGKLSLDVKSFPEVMAALLGDGHPLAKRWSRAAREAFAQKNDSIRALRVRWKNALEAATGKKGVKARRVLWEMGSDKHQTVTVNTAGPASTSTESIPITLIEQWADGSADPAAMGVSKTEAQDLIDARLALEEGDTKQNLPLKREKRGAVETVPMNEAQGVFLTMLGAQEQYTAGLDRAGWDAAALAQIEDQLSPAAKSLRAFLAKEYQEGYAPLAQVFERMFGVGLPQIKNYAPAAFYHLGTEQAMDPTGSGTIEGGFRSGFLKNRKEHQAAPKLENAFATFFGHANQTAHWKGMAEVVRELSGVFGKPEVKRAIEAAHGKEMLTAVSTWVKALEGNGLQVQSGILDSAVRWLTTQQSYIALAWKLGTVLKQSSAVLGAAFKMPTSAYLKGFGKLATGQLDVKAMFASPVIQRRLESGFAPEVRAAMNDIWSAKPTRRGAFMEQGMEFIGLVDAIFTTGSAAIAYDYHLKEAQRAGLTGVAAESAAMQEVDDIVGATAQPADAVDRSLFELRQGAFGKLVFLFASEARQKSSLWATAWGNTLTGKATAADVRVLALSHLILGPAMQAIGAMIRDARDDDDDEWFDSHNWDPMDFLKAAVAGPLAGLPLIGSAVSGFTDSGVLGRFIHAGQSARQIVEGPDPHEDETTEWYFKRTMKVMQGLDAFTGVAGSIAGQVFDFADASHDDAAETAGKEKRAKAKAKREAKASIP